MRQVRPPVAKFLIVVFISLQSAALQQETAYRIAGVNLLLKTGSFRKIFSGLSPTLYNQVYGVSWRAAKLEKRIYDSFRMGRGVELEKSAFYSLRT